MTTPAPTSITDPAVDAARAHLEDVIAGTRSNYDLDHGNPHAIITRDLLAGLIDTRAELAREILHAQRELERAIQYLDGTPVTLNSSGILQTTGAKIDQLAVLHGKQLNYARTALIAYHRHQAGNETVPARLERLQGEYNVLTAARGLVISRYDRAAPGTEEQHEARASLDRINPPAFPPARDLIDHVLTALRALA